MKSKSLEDATIKALTEGFKRTKSKKIESKKVESIDYKSAAKKINDISTEEIVNDLVKNKNCDKRIKDIADKYKALAKVDTKLDDDKYIELDNEAEKIITKLAGANLVENKLQEEWFGVKEAIYQYNGDWSDPMVKYRGYLYNYYDISDFVYNCMVEDYQEQGKELPAENTKEFEDVFAQYMYDEVPNALIDLYPSALDPQVIDFIKDGVVAGNAAEFIKKASNVDVSFDGVISRLESLKDNTDIPEKKIDEAIATLKGDNVDKSDIVDADDRLEELMPIVIDILSKVDDIGDYMYESKKTETSEIDTSKYPDPTGDIEEYSLRNDKNNPVWIIGYVVANNKQYQVNGKVFLEGSEFGIDNGPISKLWVKCKEDSKPIVSYDRGWDIRPTDDNIALYEAIMKLLVDYREKNPYEVVEDKK